MNKTKPDLNPRPPVSAHWGCWELKPRGVCGTFNNLELPKVRAIMLISTYDEIESRACTGSRVSICVPIGTETKDQLQHLSKQFF